MRILLISTYELGRQPFGLASPAACLRADGHEVTCADLAVEKLSGGAARGTDLIGFYLPMHTATRLAAPVIEAVRRVNPTGHLCCYGLYAPVNAGYLRSLGVGTILGGEFEDELRRLARALEAGNRCVSAEPLVSLERIRFEIPDRSELPPLNRYATMFDGETDRVTGYTEASRGCKHLCRHCPVVPVYNGTFRVVPADVVMADIRQQVEAGAQHITFGDPDFFNGPTHGMRIVRRMNGEFPALTYDVTIKIEHLLNRRDLLPELRRTGCLLVTTAVESIDDEVLRKLDKGHTNADFLELVRLFREQELNLSPTFIPFTPWTTWESYRELLRTLAELDLVHQVASVQLALRLLIPAGSRLLELEEIRSLVDTYQPDALAHTWQHPDPSVDRLAARLLQLVDSEQKRGASRAECFTAIWAEAGGDEPAPVLLPEQRRAPRLSEPWYCCAEPMPERMPKSDPMSAGARKHLLIVATTTGYQLNRFREVALRLGVDVSLATDRCHVLEDPWGDHAIPVRFDALEESAAALAQVRSFDAIVAIGDRPAHVAALGAQRLNVPFHRAQAAAAAINKFATRECFRKVGLPVPEYSRIHMDEDPRVAANQYPYPCVLKPLGLSTSRGVIRANDPQEFIAAFARIRKLLRIPSIARLKDPALEYIQVETFIPGCEFALEGLVTDGRLQMLALFDKPDPLDGPFFQETIYVSPSRQPLRVQEAIRNTAQRAVTALGLHQGPVHAEMRFDGERVWMLEVAPRSIGGLCAKALAFENGAPLEEIIVRHALGEDVSDARRRTEAAGVMMIPVPRAGIYKAVRGIEDAKAIADEVIVTAKEGQRLLPLPEGNTYMGFLFAYGETALSVEERLHRAHHALQFEIAGMLPVVRR